MENAHALSQNTTSRTGTKKLKGILWITSLTIAVFIGFVYGKGSRPNEINTGKNVPLVTIETTPTPILTIMVTKAPISTPEVTQPIVNNNICSMSGFAQKWEYLTSYIIKENESLQSIATSQLNDSARVNEILQLNGVGPLIVGSTLYLPPPKIAKSSGNIKQIHGRLVEKNNVSWQVSFNGDIKGQGIIIPSFWFAEIPNKDSYKIGDCLTILFDDGYKVFSVSLQ